MEPESKRVGNSGGFNLIKLLDRMTKLENSKEEHERNVGEQQIKIEELQQKLKENEYNLLMVHANELEWTVRLDDTETRYKRNEITHGGDIKLSIRAIAFLERRGEIRRAENASI